MCDGYYRKAPIDLNGELKKMRRDRNCAVSSDEDEDDDDDDDIFAKEESTAEKAPRDNPEIDDSDNDDSEFQNAYKEELEDKVILQSLKRS